MKRIFLFFITMLVFLIASCNSDFFIKGDFPDDWNNDAKPSPVIPPAGEKAGSGEGGMTDPNQPLNYGEWSDIKYYDFYKDLFSNNGYADYIKYFGFETRYMVTVNVISGGNPVNDALVELYHYDPDESDEKLVLLSAKTNVKGNAYLFPSKNVPRENITIKVGGEEKDLTYNGDTIQITLDDNAQEISILDLMFVIDTTSSMGDELRYLKTEYSNIIDSIKTGNPSYKVNLALLFYRDTGDEYITRYFGFTENNKENENDEDITQHIDFTEDVSQQQRNIDKQSTGGGGDFPEAADRALKEAVDKKWSDNATRIIFHVCDAPPHSDQISQSTYYKAVKTAAQKGIRIIPIASNGINIATEYLLRQEAIMTGGTYIFLTDYSGKDESDLWHTAGAFTEEHLNDCITRVVNEYLTVN
ncbi:vWA domain-containing protein [Treponema sp. R80B11-R83G3]